MGNNEETLKIEISKSRKTIRKLNRRAQKAESEVLSLKKRISKLVLLLKEERDKKYIINSLLNKEKKIKINWRILASKFFNNKIHGKILGNYTRFYDADDVDDPSNSMLNINFLHSGCLVEIIKQRGDFTFIKQLINGKVGWVISEKVFLVSKRAI